LEYAPTIWKVGHFNRRLSDIYDIGAFLMIKASIFKLLSYWPPYLGSGIYIKEISPNFRFIQVEMNLRIWNKNYVGTHFGGSLYSMCDPFYMLMLIANLGPNYTVWDKSASIHFRSPGRRKVIAEFHLSSEEIENIKNEADTKYKSEPIFHVQVMDCMGTLVAEIEKTLYVKKK
jgi:hypothetical protein